MTLIGRLRTVWGNQEARRDVARAAEQAEQAHDLRQQAEQVGNHSARLRQRNGFGEALGRSMGR